ncbi:hypothetical protein KP509_04G084800 [Ceratopteris richardii]|uniref:Retrovirus-related Pol polyprotein from transposon TNT 1-94 n=1 Tax=Ceratopteris richardii TaxID=49495 RepID=A0A8T2UUZ2_CERRI|nr:hypothetical protein KP509_04G084800 [Ceratopteris richardii]
MVRFIREPNVYIRHHPPHLLIVALHRPRGSLWLHQTKYATDFLDSLGFSSPKPTCTPLALKTTHSLYDSPTPENTPSLFPADSPLSLCSRFDLCFAINYLSRYMHSPSMQHWTSLKCCIRYLSTTREGGEMNSHKSTGGAVFMLGGGAVAWTSKKQSSVALSSADAEFVALALAAKEGLWLQTLIKEILPATTISLKLFCDKQPCIQLTSNRKHSEKTKHVYLKYHFIRELVEQKKLHLSYVSTHMMWADMLTKPLGVDKFYHCSKHLGLTDTSQVHSIECR